MSTVYNQIYNNNILEQQKIGASAVKLLAKEVNDAYFLGPGTVKNVRVFMPRLIDYNNSYIIGKSIVLRVAKTDYVSSTKVDVRGSWPNRSGVSVFSVRAFGDFVTLEDQPVSFSPAQLSVLLLQGNSTDKNIVISNTSASQVVYNFYNEFPSAGSDVLLSTSIINPITIASGAFETIPLSLSCTRDAFGAYYGKVVFVPTDINDANLSVPIKLVCNYAQEKLSLFPTEKIISISAQGTATDSILVCNSSPLAFEDVKASISGAASNYVFTNFFESVPADSCSTIPLSISAPASVGTYAGTISVSSTGYSSTANISLVVS